MLGYLEFRCEVSDDGHIPEYRQKQIRAALKQRAGGEVQFLITAPRRSTAANRYYRGAVLGPVLYEYWRRGTVYTSNGLHAFFKDRHLPSIAAELLMEDGVEVDYIIEEKDPSGLIRCRLTTTRLCSASFHRFIAAVTQDEYVLNLGLREPFEPVPKGLRSYALADVLDD